MSRKPKSYNLSQHCSSFGLLCHLVGLGVGNKHSTWQDAARCEERNRLFNNRPPKPWGY
jgi:hypothetical protein